MQIETDASTYLESIPKRLENSNKGTYGKILIVAGCKGMSGAAYLSALAAYRSGAGLVKILTHEENRIILQTLLPEAIFQGYDSTSDIENIIRINISWSDIVIAGPGLGISEQSAKILDSVLSEINHLWCTNVDSRAASSQNSFDTTEASQTSIPKSSDSGISRSLSTSSLNRNHIKKMPMLLIDADGINLLSKSTSMLTGLKSIALQIPVVITPHPMEMSRLTGLDISEILKEPEHIASSFAKEHHIVTLLKGSKSVISDTQGEHLFRNPVPSPALSKGGSGDVLSGAVAGIYALMRAAGKHDNAVKTRPHDCECDTQTESKPSYSSSDSFELLYKALVIAVLIHAESGRKAANIHGINGVLARETADTLGLILDSIKESNS
ncbi:ADP-dependent NAD(P)H-hydrate dehydratase [Oribacterium sp. WCC10]|uniref:ADP-dependent NAD(P)H-hydrate dehydratase n=1 Tax=Oribacterium sp. WCC10 TaxID=1855343 RepID=UPI0008EF80EA|nr:ADP/ATP-dependent (S)-NAD(P)H-hydrate dehydratase [Oribacterium sp. WCC10]SFG42037.1 NAD(P)H-hydrate epimerase [Oribacterium sp. WCC10]